MDSHGINFEFSKFDLERLKLTYVNSVIKAQKKAELQEMRELEQMDEARQLSVTYCAKCKSKLKELNIELKDDGIICDHCNNNALCKIRDHIEATRGHLTDIDFICDYFVPHLKYIK
jgi:DNA-directed RNA polymerase subunit RPC12/RpoP